MTITTERFKPVSNWEQDFNNITWQKYINLTSKLSQKILTANQSFDLIIAIARGGLVLSRLLSDSLNLPIAAFTVESYLNLQQQKMPEITHGLATVLDHRKILLVDEICDSGKTFMRGLSYLEELGAEKQSIATASLHLKKHAQFVPHYYAETTDQWVIYPYEIQETIKVLLPKWQKQGVSIEEITNRFLSWHFPKQQIEKYLNF
jgi:uncharacterized protein